LSDYQLIKNEKESVTSRSVLPSCYSFSSRASVTKIHTIRLKSRLPFSRKMIFRYVIFRCARVSAKVENWD